MSPSKPKIFESVIMASALAMILVSVFVLAFRTVYAVTFFNEIAAGLESSGWSSPDSTSIVTVGEDLTFEASYLFMKIGSVRFQFLGRVVYDSIPAYRMRAYIDSYSGFPLVDFHSVYDTYASESTLYCLFNSRSQKDGKSWVYTATKFEPERKLIQWDQSRDGKFEKEINLPFDRDYTNGVSFIYFLRKACVQSSGREDSLVVPIIDDTVRSSVKMRINEKKEECVVDAFKLPVNSCRLSGHLNFVGTFGVSGDFVGWMADDSTSLPLRANIKVLIGNVVVQLKDIKGTRQTYPGGR